MLKGAAGVEPAVVQWAYFGRSGTQVNDHCPPIYNPKRLFNSCGRDFTKISHEEPVRLHNHLIRTRAPERELALLGNGIL
jgi:hypothetical protein